MCRSILDKAHLERGCGYILYVSAIAQQVTGVTFRKKAKVNLVHRKVNRKQGRAAAMESLSGIAARNIALQFVDGAGLIGDNPFHQVAERHYADDGVIVSHYG